MAVRRSVEASVEIPVVFLMPREGSDESGLGDITLGGKVLVFQSIDQPALVTVGSSWAFPADRRAGDSAARSA